MVCISLQLAEKPSAAGVLNDQEGRSAGLLIGKQSTVQLIQSF
jgi:hypothetical protein